MLKSEKINGVVVVSFDHVNKFNALITEPVKEELKSFFNRPSTRMILNLDGVQYIDSSGFGVFLSVLKTANNNYGSFKISNVSPEVMELFRLLQLHTIFDITPTVDDALATFA